MAWEAQAEVPGGFAEEAGLVAGLRAGRRDAFEALHAAYAARIYNLALRIVDDTEEAQDVAQEVLLTVFRSLPGNETDLNLPAWLYRVTVNKAFDHIRARKRRPFTVMDEAAPEAQSAVDEYERAELSRRVDSTLRELPKRQQLALVLRDVNGLSVGETASVLGLTRGSADVLLSRARASFRRVFLTGAGSLTGRCDLADKALAAGVGRGERVPSSLVEHSRTCPDCRRAVEVWGAAPIGLGLLLSQVALPANLSLGATLAAAQAAGIAVPVGLGAAGTAGASSSAAGASVAAASAVGGAAGATAGSVGGAGLLAALGSAAGVKIATLAVVATAAVGVAGVATQRAHRPAGASAPAAAHPGDAGAAAQGVRAGADGSGQSPGERARQMRRAHASAGAGQTLAGADDRKGSRATDAGGAGPRAGAAGRTNKAGRAGGSVAGVSAGVAGGGPGRASGVGGSGAGSGVGETSGPGGGSGQVGDGSGSGEGGGQSGHTGGGSTGGMFSPE